MYYNVKASLFDYKVYPFLSFWKRNLALAGSIIYFTEAPNRSTISTDVLNETNFNGDGRCLGKYGSSADLNPSTRKSPGLKILLLTIIYCVIKSIHREEGTGASGLVPQSNHHTDQSLSPSFLISFLFGLCRSRLGLVGLTVVCYCVW